MLASKSLMPYDISAQAQRLAQPSRAEAPSAEMDRKASTLFQRLAARWLEAKRRESQRIIEDVRRYRLHMTDQK